MRVFYSLLSKVGTFAATLLTVRVTARLGMPISGVLLRVTLSDDLVIATA
jgi:hypothetical protein